MRLFNVADNEHVVSAALIDEVSDEDGVAGEEAEDGRCLPPPDSAPDGYAATRR